jgi:hypothetical protein
MTGCGGHPSSEGTTPQEQLARIKKLESQGKPLGAKQRELLEESRQQSDSNSTVDSGDTK